MHRRRLSLARAAMQLLCTLLGIVLATMLGFTLYFQQIMGLGPFGQLSGSRFPSGQNPASLLSETGSGDSRIGGTDSDLVNILLIGQDRRENESTARSDSMILCTLNKNTNQIILTSFLRDLYVPIPGHSQNRINAAYAIGGAQLLQKTLEENFHLVINGYAEVDFAQFSGIIDTLGGVRIQLRQDEAEEINRETGSSLREGLQTLNGPQALAYSRIRKLDTDGDFSRTNRQRSVMEGLWQSYKNAGMATILKTLRDILPMITTDMSSPELLGYLLPLLPRLSETTVVSQRIPADGQYTDETIDGMSVLVTDLESARQSLHSSLSN